VVGETYAQARALAEQLDRTDYLVPLLLGEYNFRVFRAEWILVLSLAEQIDKMGGARNDGAALLISSYMRGIAHFNLGEFVSARTLLEQCLSGPAYRSVIAAMTAEDPHVTMLWLGVTLAHLGYVEQGRGWVKEAMSEVRRLDHAYTVAVALTFAWWVEWVASSPNEARRRAEELTALSNEHGFPVWLGWGLIERGWSLTALGQAQEGLALLTRGLPMLRATGAITSTPLALMLFADTYAKLGQPVEGLDCVAEATQIVATTDERYIEAELYRLRGDLLNDTGDRAAAEQNYHQALAVAKRQSAKVFELRATTSLARLWRDHGKRTEARELLAPIYGWFTEGLDTPVLQEAKVLLEQLAS
jgi:tetratricopeptide (TPR) repeat protein